MKTFTAKTVEEAVNQAAQDLGVEPKDVIFVVKEEKKGFLSKKAVIDVYETSDAIEFAQQYLKKAIAEIGIEVETTATYEDEIIRIALNSDHNPILIGKNGNTLQALNELTKLAVSNKFKRRFRVLLDVNDYKDKKYSRIARQVRQLAKEVQKTHVDVTLDPMSADERRVVHNALTNFSHIVTESKGEGTHRAVTIKYSENK